MADNNSTPQVLPVDLPANSPVELPVESMEVTNKVILYPDGTTTLIGSTREVAIVLLDGGHRFEKTHILTATVNGRVVDHSKGEIACNCPNCHRGPYSTDFMSMCASCGHTVGLSPRVRHESRRSWPDSGFSLDSLFQV